MQWLQALAAAWAGRAEQARMRRELAADVTGRRVTRHWTARGRTSDSSFDRLTLALDDRQWLEIFSTGLDARGRRVALAQLRRQEFRHSFPGATHSRLVPQGLDGLCGRTIARCQLDQDERGDVLAIWPRQGAPAIIRASTGRGRGGLVLRLRQGHAWEGGA